MSSDPYTRSPSPNDSSGEDVPYQQIFNAIVQRLVQLVGLHAASTLTSTVPGLTLDPHGQVLEYSGDNPHTIVRLLVEQYEARFGEVGLALIQQATRDFKGEAAARFLQETGIRQPAPIRVLLVDDHVLVREGLVGLIDSQPDFRVVGEAGSIREAVPMVRRLQPDLILMDFSLPDGTGDEATRIILSMLPETKIVFLTVHDEDERIFAALSAGAMGYLLKSVRSADLVSRLRGVVQGDVALSPTIGRRVLEQFVRLPTKATVEPMPIGELTERENEILRLIVQGHTNRQIADALNLSVRTVEYHRANLTSKLGLHSRADLVRFAAEYGLLSDKVVNPKLGVERQRKL